MTEQEEYERRRIESLVHRFLEEHNGTDVDLVRVVFEDIAGAATIEAQVRDRGEVAPGFECLYRVDSAKALEWQDGYATRLATAADNLSDALDLLREVDEMFITAYAESQFESDHQE